MIKWDGEWDNNEEREEINQNDTRNDDERLKQHSVLGVIWRKSAMGNTTDKKCRALMLYMCDMCLLQSAFNECVMIILKMRTRNLSQLPRKSKRKKEKNRKRENGNRRVSQ